MTPYKRLYPPPNTKSNENQEFKTWISHLENERSKLKNLEMVLAVIGTMKAGKSTTINAIVGMEILPNRETAMTTLPTLIRNKHGQTEPVLSIQKIQPLLELSSQVAQKLKPLTEQQKNAIDLNGIDDGKSLIEQLITENGYAFKTQYQGQNAIFEFLRHLNDIMRLAKDEHIDIEPPYHQYENVEDLPVIEVEFCHLKDHQDLAQGSLAILDTPGPNEFGQSAALRNVFKTQLEKASAILLVTDFTQMKTEADQGVRDQLAEIDQYLSKDRLAVVVNKFDQQTENSMSVEDLKNYVSSKLMADKVDINQVFPVSSRKAYLANRAKSCLEYDGKLPPLEPKSWVYFFAKEAEVSKRINDINAVKEGIETLWQESFFAEPIEKVIKEAHASAANKSLDSAIKKLKNYHTELSNQLGFYSASLKQEIDNIKKMKQELEKDIQSCEQVKDDVNLIITDSKKKLVKELSDIIEKQKNAIEEQTDNIFENALKGANQRKKLVEKDRDNDLKKIREMTKKDFKLTILSKESFDNYKKDEETRIKQLYEQLLTEFNVEQSKIKFNTEELSKSFTKSIISAITKNFNQAEQYFNSAIAKTVEQTKQSLSSKVDMTVSETLKKAEDKLSKSSGVSLNSHLPPIELAIADIDSSMLFNIGQDEEVVTYNLRRHKDNFWGSFCKFFNSDDWGTEEYEKTKINYVVDLELKKQEINQQLESRFNQQVLHQIADYLTHQFEPLINQHLDDLVYYLQQYLSILNNAIESHKLDETTKKALVCHLTELLKNQAVLKGDIDTVNKGQAQL